MRVMGCCCQRTTQALKPKIKGKPKGDAPSAKAVRVEMHVCPDASVLCESTSRIEHLETPPGPTRSTCGGK
jgi:hypothetical protein